EHDVAPPSAERKELDEAVLGDRLHHEAHLVEMAGEHHLRSGAALLLADEAAEAILRDGTDALEVAGHHARDGVLEAGCSVGVDEFLQEAQRGIHEISWFRCGPSLRRRCVRRDDGAALPAPGRASAARAGRTTCPGLSPPSVPDWWASSREW